MNIEQQEAMISRLEAELIEYSKQADGTVAQMTAQIEGEKQNAETRLNALIRERDAQMRAFREEYLRKEGYIQARRDMLTEAQGDAPTDRLHLVGSENGKISEPA